jgi:hypothetical protein
MIDASNVADSIAAVIGQDEELITLTEATRHLPKVDGKKVPVCTLWRWCRKPDTFHTGGARVHRR